MEGKRGKAVEDSSLNTPAPAFSVAFNLLSEATNGGTTCNGPNILKGVTPLEKMSKLRKNEKDQIFLHKDTCENTRTIVGTSKICLS